MIKRSVHPSASSRTQNLSSAMENRFLIDQQLSSSYETSSLIDRDFNHEFEISSLIILHQDTFESKWLYYKTKNQT